MWCPDIPDESPDISDGAMQNFWPFDVSGCPDSPDDNPDSPDLVAKKCFRLFDLIYASCILPWLIVL